MPQSYSRNSPGLLGFPWVLPDDDRWYSSHIPFDFIHIHAYIPEKNVLPNIRLFFSQKKDKKNGKTWIHMTYNSLSEKNTKTREFPLGPNALRLWDREKTPCGLLSRGHWNHTTFWGGKVSSRKMKLEILDGTLDCLFVFSTNFARNVSGNVTNSMFFCGLADGPPGGWSTSHVSRVSGWLGGNGNSRCSDRVDRPMGAWLLDVGQLHVDVVCLLSFLFGVWSIFLRIPDMLNFWGLCHHLGRIHFVSGSKLLSNEIHVCHVDAAEWSNLMDHAIN